MTAYPITVDELEDGHALVLGTTGSGKTYQLRGMLEQLRGADRRVGAIDKLGNHWGLTLKPDGETAGLDFVIFGGKRAQVPMTPEQGAQLGRLFVERNVPAIFDVSQWHADEQQRWVGAFADAVFMANTAALHLALDEAQSWVPQGGGGEAFRAVQRLAEQGRGNGIRLLMSCQRLSRLDATVRGMVHLVVAMRQPGVLDRKAVKELISASAHDAAVLERDLPKMPTGTGYRWSADGAELTKIKFPRNATFDSSRTPRHGDAPPAPIAVSSALVDELTAALAPAPHPDDVIPDDPQAAYAKGNAVGGALAERDRRIAALEADLADRDDQLGRLQEIAQRHEAFVGGFAEIARTVAGLHDLVANFHRPDAKIGKETFPPAASPSAVAAPTDAGSVDSPVSAGAANSTARGRKALAALATIHPAALSEAQWATLAGYAKSGGTWGTYKGALRAAGHVEQLADGTWRATPAGVKASGATLQRLPAPGPERAAFWGARIPGARRMVDVLAKRWPHFTTRDALASDLSMAPGGGTFGTYLGRLRSNGLLEESKKRLRLAPAIMGDEA